MKDLFPLYVLGVLFLISGCGGGASEGGGMSTGSVSSKTMDPSVTIITPRSITPMLSGDILRVTEADFAASAGLITFSEFGLGTSNPMYQAADYGGSSGQPTVKFGGFFDGQRIGETDTCPPGAAVSGCVLGSPKDPLKLDSLSPNTFITGDGANPTSPVLSGTPIFNGPIAILFSQDQAGVGLDGGYFDALGGTAITAFRRDGSIIGSFANEAIGIEFLGLKTTDGSATIAGVLLSLVGDEPAGFAIDNIRFAETMTQGWIWPLPSPNITQDFNCYGCFRAGLFHVGVDLTSTSEDVLAAREGEVIEIFRTADNSNVWCDGTDLGLRSIETDPSSALGYGNTIIIKHPRAAEGGKDLFSLYAHLSCLDRGVGQGFINSKATGVSWAVDQGSVIGQFGGSGAKKLDAYRPHLHFEIRDFRQLAKPRAEGYSAIPADTLGFYNPFLLIHEREFIARDIQHGVILENANVRLGPMLYRHSDLVPNVLTAGTEIAIKEMARTSDGEWVQVALGLPHVVITRRGQIDNNSPEGWISRELVAPYAGFRTSIFGEPGSIVDVYDDKDELVAKVLAGQTFPRLGTKNASTDMIDRGDCVEDMVQIDLGVVNNARGTARFGWVCGSDTWK